MVRDTRNRTILMNYKNFSQLPQETRRGNPLGQRDRTTQSGQKPTILRRRIAFADANS